MYINYNFSFNYCIYTCTFISSTCYQYGNILLLSTIVKMFRKKCLLIYYKLNIYHNRHIYFQLWHDLSVPSVLFLSAIAICGHHQTAEYHLFGFAFINCKKRFKTKSQEKRFCLCLYFITQTNQYTLLCFK